MDSSLDVVTELRDAQLVATQPQLRNGVNVIQEEIGGPCWSKRILREQSTGTDKITFGMGRTGQCQVLQNT